MQANALMYIIAYMYYDVHVGYDVHHSLHGHWLSLDVHPNSIASEVIIEVHI